MKQYINMSFREENLDYEYVQIIGGQLGSINTSEVLYMYFYSLQ